MPKYHVQFVWESYIDFGEIEAKDAEEAEAKAQEEYEHATPGSLDEVVGDDKWQVEETES